MKPIIHSFLAVSAMLFASSSLFAQFYLGQWVSTEDGESIYWVFTADSLTQVTLDEDEGCYNFDTYAYSVDGDVLTIQDDEEPFGFNAYMDGDILMLSGVGDAEGDDYELNPNSDNLDALVDCKNPTTGVGEIPVIGLTISPNPMQASAVVELSVLPAQCRIYDAHGRLVFEEVVRNPRMVFERGRLGSGVYFMHVRTDQANQMQKLVIE